MHYIMTAVLAAPAAALAHPGHGILDNGPAHALMSADHLIMATAFVGLVIAIGRFLRRDGSSSCT
jgi:putative copper export protein